MAYGRTRVGWKDLTSDLVTRTSGSSVPAYSQIGSTNFFAYEFPGTGTQVKEIQSQYHLLHDNPTGKDFYIHVHWYPATAAAGNVKWYFQLAYAKGHNQGAFNFASPVSVNITQAAPGVAYQHMIAEVAFSNTGGTGGLLDNANFETDGIIICRTYRDPADVADTYGASAFVHMIDIHYQGDRDGTTFKAPPFDSV